MDWQAIAGLLGERSERALVLLDRSARIRLFTGRMEQTLGWRRHEVEGRTWTEALVPDESVETARRWLSQALRGALARYECEALSRDGHRYSLLVDMALVGRGSKQGLLLTIQEVSRIEDHATPANRDVDYRVTASAADFGKVDEIARGGNGGTLQAGARQPCFALLYRRETPCPDCPLLQPPETAWPRTTVRADEAGGFHIVTATPVSKTAVHVSVRVITDASLGAIQGARINSLAEKARLTERERDILGYLLLGRSLDDIASLLELSRRTVKFHQGNILQKLGADSRTDLIRLIGF